VTVEETCGAVVIVDLTLVVEDADEVEDEVEEDEVVDDEVVETSSFPAVTVTICAPSAELASVKVVVAETAVLVIVPSLAEIVLLHWPCSEAVMLHPTVTVPAGSDDAVGVCV